MKRVELDKYRQSETLLLSGNARGQAVRLEEELDKLDQTDSKVTVVVPDDVFAVTSSFLSGLFAKSIRTLGKEGFRDRYIFSGKPIHETIDAVIEYASKNQGGDLNG